jgi:hypothetical protein
MAAHIAGEVPHWSLVGDELMTHRTGRIHNPARIPALVAPLLRIADLIEAGGAV